LRYPETEKPAEPLALDAPPPQEETGK